MRQARGREVNLNMEDHRNEQYVKPKVSTKAFTGEGHMLGRYVCLNSHMLGGMCVYTGLMLGGMCV